MLEIEVFSSKVVQYPICGVPEFITPFSYRWKRAPVPRINLRSQAPRLSRDLRRLGAGCWSIAVKRGSMSGVRQRLCGWRNRRVHDISRSLPPILEPGILYFFLTRSHLKPAIHSAQPPLH